MVRSVFGSNLPSDAEFIDQVMFKPLFSKQPLSFVTCSCQLGGPEGRASHLSCCASQADYLPASSLVGDVLPLSGKKAHLFKRYLSTDFSSPKLSLVTQYIDNLFCARFKGSRSQTALDAFYNRISPEGLKKIRDKLGLDHQDVDVFINSLQPVDKTGPVLDLGAWYDGRVSVAMLDKGFEHVVAMEGNPKAVKALRLRSGSRKGLTVLERDITKSDCLAGFKPGSFYLILGMWALIYDFPPYDPSRPDRFSQYHLIEKMLRMLRSGGKLVLEVPGIKSPGEVSSNITSKAQVDGPTGKFVRRLSDWPEYRGYPIFDDDFKRIASSLSHFVSNVECISYSISMKANEAVKSTQVDRLLYCFTRV